MAAKGVMDGREIEFVEGAWRFSDTKEPLESRFYTELGLLLQKFSYDNACGMNQLKLADLLMNFLKIVEAVRKSD